MPWSAPSVIELRIAFVHAVRTAKRPLAVACRDFRISRKTGYKWLARFALVCGTDVTMARAWNVLWNVFGEYGLPDAILCDNAFGSLGPGVSWFEARLMRLDVRVVHGRPYHPPDPGQGRAIPRHARSRDLPTTSPRQPRPLPGRIGTVATRRLQRDPAPRGSGRRRARYSLATLRTTSSRQTAHRRIPRRHRDPQSLHGRRCPLALCENPGRPRADRRIRPHRRNRQPREPLVWNPPHSTNTGGPTPDRRTTINSSSVTYVPATRATYVPALNTTRTLAT